MSGVLTISSEDLDRLVRETAERLLAPRIAALSARDLATSLDWMPAEWFAAQWSREVATVHVLLRKLRVKTNAVSQKTKLYSIADANEKISGRALAGQPRRRARPAPRIVPFTPPVATVAAS